MRRKLYAVALGLSLLGIPAMAQDKVTTHQVHFKKGMNGATMKGSVKGTTRFSTNWVPRRDSICA